MLFQIALDYLPIQATSVPSECAFSSAAETDSPKRSRISPELFEALQILKYLLKQRRLTFTSHMIPLDKLQDALLLAAHTELELRPDEVFTIDDLMALV